MSCLAVLCPRLGAAGRTLRRWLLAGAMLLSAAGAAAQASGADLPEPPAAPPEAEAGERSLLEYMTGVPIDAAQRTRKLVAMVEARIDAMRTNPILAEAGKYLLAVLATVTITWSLVKNMVLKPGLPQLLADLVFPGVVLALGLTAIQGNFAEAIARLVESTALALSATPAPHQSVAAGFLARSSEMLVTVWSTRAPFDYFELGASFFRGLVLQAVATLLIAVAAATGVAMLFLAKLQVAIACALAPVMIPWLLWRPAEFLFTGWLTFLLRGGFIAVAVFAVERVMSEAMQGVSTIASGVAPGFDSSLAYGAMAVLALVFAFMMLKCGELGSGLVGGAVVGIGGLGALAGQVGSPARTAARQVLGGGLAGAQRGGARTNPASRNPNARGRPAGSAGPGGSS